jgi:hypothetical protein
MVVELIQSFFGSELGTVTLLLIFIIFIVLVRKLIKIAMSAVWIGFVSALFPLFLKFGLGMDIPLNFGTFVYYITFGLGLFCIYILASLIYKMLGAFERGAKAASPFSNKDEKKK